MLRLFLLERLAAISILPVSWTQCLASRIMLGFGKAAGKEGNESTSFVNLDPIV